MNTVMVVLAVILGVVGIIGSIVPGLPGPPLSWVGILLMYFFGGTNAAGEPMSLTLLFVLLGVTTIPNGSGSTRPANRPMIAPHEAYLLPPVSLVNQAGTM